MEGTAPIGVLIALGSGLRLFGLDRQSLWFDESLSVAIAKYPIGDVLQSPLSVHPPLYYALLHYWMRVTSTDWGIRLLSAAFGVCSILVLYWLGRMLFGRATGLVAGFIMAISPFQIYYAQEARMYTLVLAMSSISLIAYLRATRTGRARDWLIFGAAMTAAVYAHTYAFLALLVLDVVWLYLFVRKRQVSYALPLVNILILLAFLPWLSLLYQKVTVVMSEPWLVTPTPLSMLTSLYLFLVSYTAGASLVPIALFAVIALLSLVVWSAARFPPAVAPQRQALLLVACLTFVPLIAVYAASLFRPAYNDRLLIVSTPGYYLLLAWGVTSSRTRRVIRLTSLPVLAVVMVSLVNYYFDATYGKAPIRDVAEYLQRRVSPSEMVVHTSASTYLASEHYGGAARGLLLVTAADAWLPLSDARGSKIEGTAPNEQLLERYDGAWLIVALDHNEEGQRTVKRWFDERYALEEEDSFGGIGVYRYRVR